MTDCKLTLGPLLYHWPTERKLDFYRRIAAEAPVDTVVLGEVVCPKRTAGEEILPELIDLLQAAGKEVVLGSLALVMQPRERHATAELLELDLPVEAGDGTALALLRGRPHHAGPLVHVANEGTLAMLAGQGLRRICLAGELPGSTVAILAAEAARLGVEAEAFVFGRLPLAISARCYHARNHGLAKDGCQFVCGEDPDGLVVDTLDGTPFVAINGVQTQTHSYVDLVGDLAALRAMGIHRFRLSPQDLDMVAVARTVRAALDGQIDPEEAADRLQDLTPDTDHSNGFFHGLEGRVQVAGHSPGLVE